MGATTNPAHDRVAERRRAVALARHYREAEGLSIAEIARRLGRALATIKSYFCDHTGEKAKAVKARYQGICRGCGAPTQPRNGKGDAYEYCIACHPGAIAPLWTPARVRDAMRAWQNRYGRLPSSYDLVTRATHAAAADKRWRGWTIATGRRQASSATCTVAGRPRERPRGASDECNRAIGGGGTPIAERSLSTIALLDRTGGRLGELSDFPAPDPGRSDDRADGRLVRLGLINAVSPAAALNPAELSANQPDFDLGIKRENAHSPGILLRLSTDAVSLAMQKVEGSSPFSRLR